MFTSNPAPEEKSDVTTPEGVDVQEGGVDEQPIEKGESDSDSDEEEE